jgi:MCP family monocarboxylic acid transporter-like MFS transporter 10
MKGKLDGGLSWLIVLSSFIQQFVMMGTHNVFGLFYIDLLNEFKKGKAATGTLNVFNM